MCDVGLLEFCIWIMNNFQLHLRLNLHTIEIFQQVYIQGDII
jgi:hypothetical protein